MITPAVCHEEKIRFINARFLLAIGGLLSVLTLLLSLSFPFSLTIEQLWSSIFSPNMLDYQQVIIHFSYLPRIAIALLCGAGLAIAGTVMQYVLQNPLASPTTLGVAAGAELGLIASTLLVATPFYLPPYAMAFLGGLLATGLVFLLTAKRGFAPLQMVLAGLVVSLFLGSLNTLLLLVNDQQLAKVFIWGAGALEQTDWQRVQLLIPLLLMPLAFLLLTIRPLTLLQLGEEVASSTGVNVAFIRIAALVLAVFMTAAVVSQVGIIGFIGLIAPTVARLLGARQLLGRILVAAVIGALLLLMADLATQPFSSNTSAFIPTGAVTALMGAPVLLWLLGRKTLASTFKAEEEVAAVYRKRSLKKLLPVLLLLTTMVFLWRSLSGIARRAGH